MKQNIIVEWTILKGEYEFYFDDFGQACEFWNQELTKEEKRNGQFFEKKYKYSDDEYIELDCKIIS